MKTMRDMVLQPEACHRSLAEISSVQNLQPQAFIWTVEGKASRAAWVMAGIGCTQ